MPLRLIPIVQGSEAGETIFFLQGWPDDASLWDEAVIALQDRYRCVRVNLPNYGGPVTTRWGYGTEEIVEAVVALLRELGAARPVTLVLHDWGCYWGHAAHHRCPEIVARVAGLDVAPHYEPTLFAALMIIAYQWWLLAAFVIAGPIGNWMTRRLARLARAPAKQENIDARMNYPYRNIWADMLTGRYRRLMRGYWPTCPLLFVYGARKPAPFHSRAWVDHVQKSGGQVVEMRCGHWVTRDRSFVGVLTGWLESTGKVA